MGIQRLLLLAQSGEEQALADLLVARRDELKRLARQLVGTTIQPKLDASDIVQDTLAKGHQAFSNFNGTTDLEFLSWLRQILTRQVAESIRRYRGTASRQLARERSINATAGMSSGLLQNGGMPVVAENSSPSSPMHRAELQTVLRESMHQLPDAYCQVLRLRSLMELDWPDVAPRMQRSIGSVRMMWVRALRQIRPLVEKRL